MADIILKYSSRFPKDEVCPEFYQGMLNRMSVGLYRHGPLSKNPKPAWKWLGEVVRKFERTGNLELLMDIANYAANEFKHPRHPKAHYKEEDQGFTRSECAYFHLSGKGM